MTLFMLNASADEPSNIIQCLIGYLVSHKHIPLDAIPKSVDVRSN